MPGAPPGTAPATGSPAAVAGDQVIIDNFAFAPATLTVKVGSTVTWTNRDEEPHTVAANDGSFHSPGMGTGATFSHTFATAGKFRLRLLDPPVHARHRGGDPMTPRSAHDDAAVSSSGTRHGSERR